MLSALLLCNTTVVYADDTHGGSSGSIDVTPTITIPQPAIDPHALDELIFRLVRPDIAGVADNLQTWWDKWIGDRWKTNADMLKDVSLSSDGSTVHLHKQFVDDVNTAVQDSVHALDGYYLIEPTYDKSFLTFQSVLKDKQPSVYDFLMNYSESEYNQVSSAFSSSCPFGFLDDDYFYYFSSNSDIFLYIVNSSDTVGYYDNGVYSDKFCMHCMRLMRYGLGLSSGGTTFTPSFFTKGDFSKVNLALFGAPFKLFYSRHDLDNYLNNGKKRTYAPKLPNVTIKIPVKYINNSVSLPDITYNITTENKTEVEIQNQYDTTIKNYLDNLDNFTDGTDPTPTPTPSGGFTDGTTPTPTPAIGDGGDDSGNGKVDLSEITDLLKKILDKLTSFADSHSQFEKTITDYIESTDGKLDQIIDAIDKLSQGKEDGEDYKCKYDYTELSDYLKKLWNDSDKKFDTMIDLLEENNEYQQKLVDTLDSIKSILIKESIMDSFKDRSKETANKAKEKFPTSVPWDIAIVINAMSATPEEPKFNLPIKIASLNIDENIEVDLSSGEWEKLAKTCRYMLSLLFVLFMVQLSRRLFFNKGDDD